MNAYDYDTPTFRAARCNTDGRLDVIIEKGSITPLRADGSTQRALYDTARNETTNLRVVPAGKTLHLTDWVVTIHQIGAVNVNAQFFVTNAANGTQYRIVNFWTSEVGNWNLSGNCPVPLEIQEGWKVKILSDNDDMYVYAFIHGFEI